MREKTENILNVAEDYEKSFDVDSFSRKEMNYIFKEIISDYKKMVKKAKRQGFDMISDEERFEQLFKIGSIKEKECLMDDIEDRIGYLIDVCQNVPDKLRKKYRKDLVDLIDEQEIFEN